MSWPQKPSTFSNLVPRTSISHSRSVLPSFFYISWPHFCCSSTDIFMRPKKSDIPFFLFLFSFFRIGFEDGMRGEYGCHPDLLIPAGGYRKRKVRKKEKKRRSMPPRRACRDRAVPRLHSRGRLGSLKNVRRTDDLRSVLVSLNDRMIKELVSCLCSFWQAGKEERKVRYARYSLSKSLSEHWMGGHSRASSPCVQFADFCQN